MKKILIATALLAGFTFAGTNVPVDSLINANPGKLISPTPNFDSLIAANKAKDSIANVAHKTQVDSLIAANKVKDSLANVAHKAQDAANKAKLDSLIAANKVKDSVLFATHKAKVDSLLANVKKCIPDSLNAKLAAAVTTWKTVDSIKVDSIKNVFSGKRDTLIAQIKSNDTAAAAKIKARIAELEANRTALKAKLDARKAEIDAKIADLKKNKK
jgi:hypothetical protein